MSKVKEKKSWFRTQRLATIELLLPNGKELTNWTWALYASKYGKLSSGHRTGKGQFSFQSLKKAMPKNTKTTAHLHSSHTLAKQCSKFSKPGFSNT